MVFSGIVFLYFFLPATLLLYFIVPMPGGSPRYRNLLLLAASLLFYAWGEPSYVFLMVVQCLSAWFFGLLMDRYRTKARVIMLISVVISLSGLLFFKYADFFIQNINRAGAHIPLLRVALPIGISFYTFQIMSYTLDLYRGKTEVQHNLFDFSTYVALFPQLIAGPIVRYTDVAVELNRRRHTLPQFSVGARRFIIGLAKKVLLANLLGELVAIYKQNAAPDTLFTWMYLVAYSLHIYFDFSGYSDMAIGLGHILGFRFPENFNYPFIADSVSDFWRRWHMSLSGWFRDYVYIPLGGNRVSAARAALNLLVVWTLTGFWHGADWNFMIWGFYFGLVLLVEKQFLSGLLEKMPRPLRHVYVLLIIFLSWTIFDGQGLANTLSILHSALRPDAAAFFSREALYYLRSYLVPLSVGVIGCTPLPGRLAGRLAQTKAFTYLEPAALAALFLVSTAFIVDGSFNPFIYFRF